MSTKSLKLIVRSDDDLTILSALLQDMTVRVGDIAWLPKENRLACVGNRFVWEKKFFLFKGRGKRVRTAFHVSSVLNVQLLNIDQADSEAVLELLNIEAEKQDEGVRVVFNFAGGASIAADAETLDIIASDLSEPWQAIARPHHD